MLSEAKHLSHYFATLSFRPSLLLVILTDPHTVISTERSEWRNLFILRGSIVGIYALRRLQLRRCGELALQGSPRSAWLLSEYHPECPYGTFLEKSVTPNVLLTPKVAVLWTRNALSMNRLTINTVGQNAHRVDGYVAEDEGVT